MIAFQAASAATSSASASSTTITWPGLPSGQLLIAVFGFEGVASGSGPYVNNTPQSGWEQQLFQAPSATGCGLEVWNTQSWSSGPTTTFNFNGSPAFVAQGLVYTGQFTGAGDVIRASTSQSVSGNNGQSPGIFAFANELVIVLISQQITAAGFVAPTGFTKRVDSARGATAGNVEIAVADQVAAVQGSEGPFTWTATASPANSKGAAATLCVRAAGSTPGTTQPFISMRYPLT